MARAVRRIVLAGLALVGLALFALWRIDNPRIEQLRMASADVLAPAVDAVAAPLADAATLARDWERLSAVHAQNRELRREIQRLRAWRDAAQELERENARLRALNNVRLSPRIGFATGEVIADAGGPFGQSALVNIGGRDGVTDGAAAVDGAGLVGRVVGVGEGVARVLLLSDPSSRVPVKILPSGRRAVLVGDASPAPRLAFLAATEDVSVGDKVVTSGDGGVFPPDLDVGIVAAIDGRAARVRLSADYGLLEFVRVLRWRPEAPLDAPSALILPQGAAPFSLDPGALAAERTEGPRP
ncbi:MAG: rod shape-determining protein MreC [Rubrimonas sp.]|uniref:rod shape-determining protein MreC n=1 Tax=Rubrimonas sp. TaxID=2036015 RepID=UPI002FDD42C9